MRTIGFVLSALSAVLAGILLGGFAGVSAQVGLGLEFEAIAAVVLGGVVLAAVAARCSRRWPARSRSRRCSPTLLNLLGVSGALEDAVRGAIIIAAVAFASLRGRELR